MNSLVEMRNITKRFTGVVALSSVNFDVQPGKVPVMLGESGARKSTLMKMLGGAYVPSEGTMVADGKEFPRLTPRISQENGISIIYQELSVINEISIQENIFVGKLIAKNVAGIKVLDNKAMKEKTKQILDEIGLKKEPSTPVGQLSISEKQMVEIGKAVAFDAKVIIMDEPTSSLTRDEINRLFSIITKLKEQGKGIVFISHKLDEVMRIGDRVTVLKDGQYMGTYPISEMDQDKLVKLMVGREIKGKYLKEKEFAEEVIFEVNGLTRKDDKVRDVSFKLRKGEILGFSGLVGAGRTELMEAIYGAEPMKSGEITLLGEKLKIKKPYDALKAGIALVTENRRETGFSPFFSIKQNIIQAKYLKESKFGGITGLVNLKMENRVGEEQRKALQIKCSSIEQIITELSGGNQQKVILGRWMASDPKLIIFDEPTKGIDVGTKSEIYKLMRALADEGIGVLVVSSELPELLSTCDRIIVFSEGNMKGEFESVKSTEEDLIRAATTG